MHEFNEMWVKHTFIIIYMHTAAASNRSAYIHSNNVQTDRENRREKNKYENRKTRIKEKCPVKNKKKMCEREDERWALTVNDGGGSNTAVEHHDHRCALWTQNVIVQNIRKLVDRVHLHWTFYVLFWLFSRVLLSLSCVCTPSPIDFTILKRNTRFGMNLYAFSGYTLNSLTGIDKWKKKKTIFLIRSLKINRKLEIMWLTCCVFDEFIDSLAVRCVAVMCICTVKILMKIFRRLRPR